MATGGVNGSRISASVRWAAIIVVTLLEVLTISAAIFAHQAVAQRTSERFNNDAMRISAHLVNNLAHSTDVLYSGRAFLLSRQTPNNTEWDNFFRAQDIYSRDPGISTVAHIAIFEQKDRNNQLNRIRNINGLGSNLDIKPTGERDLYGIADLYSSAHDVSRSIGTDVLAEPSRRELYLESVGSVKPLMSAPFNFSTGFKGFFMALPVKPGDQNSGIVAAYYRLDDFFKDILDDQATLGLPIKITDVTNKEQPVNLYQSKAIIANNSMTYTDNLSFSNRQWKIEYHSSPNTYPAQKLGMMMPIIILACGTAFALLMMLVFSIVIRIVQFRIKP